MAATAVEIPIDGGGDQRREAAGDEENNPETLEAERAEREQNLSEKFPKKIPFGIYSRTLSV